MTTINLGQNIVNEFTKLSNYRFSYGMFAADFSQFSSIIVKICLLVGRSGTCRHFQAFQELP